LAITAFERSIGLDQFLDGIEDDQEKAVEAGFLADSTFQAIQDSLPVWYAFLDQRRIQDGDRIFYRFFPGGVRTQ
ncbi:MAG: hypothetical protein GWO24_30440, partial [Akkermansiaceae bacterium]|nr:hypothetical protein [Akkermansiaceae bacterium]